MASFAAMGTTVTVRLDHPDADALTAQVGEMFQQWEATLSRFRPESELSGLNARAGSPTRVSPLLGRVLGAALCAARATGGVFDPTLGRQMVSAGYATSITIPSGAGLRRAPARPGGGWRDIVLDHSASTARIPEGVAVDLGGIAKGMAVDAAVTLLTAAGVRHALVDAGGDMRVVGLHGAGWPVGLTDVPGQFLTLRDGALATSSTARRRWKVAGVEHHHLIDPRSGAPARSGAWSVSVAGRTCEHAEVAAKCALILGPVDGAVFLARHGLAGVISPTTGEPIMVGKWPSHQAVAA